MNNYSHSILHALYTVKCYLYNKRHVYFLDSYLHLSPCLYCSGSLFMRSIVQLLRINLFMRSIVHIVQFKICILDRK